MHPLNNQIVNKFVKMLKEEDQNNKNQQLHQNSNQHKKSLKTNLI